MSHFLLTFSITCHLYLRLFLKFERFTHSWERVEQWKDTLGPSRKHSNWERRVGLPKELALGSHMDSSCVHGLYCCGMPAYLSGMARLTEARRLQPLSMSSSVDCKSLDDHMQ